MTFSTRWQHSIRVALALAILTAGLASTASARHYGVRYKGAPRQARVVRYAVPAPAYVTRGSCDTPAFAGFVGGMILGAVLSHAATAHAEFAYVDPYCDERFPSYDEYLVHLRHHHHPRIVRVIEVDSGDWVRTCRYEGGRWSDVDDRYEDWDD